MIVNARTGAILARQSLTDYFSTAKTAPKHAQRGPDLHLQRRPCPPPTAPVTSSRARTRSAPASGRSTGFAAATIHDQRRRLKLFFGASTTPLITADTLFSPEQFHYAPAGGVPPGDYFVQVCDFADGAAWAAPRTYTGT